MLTFPQPTIPIPFVSWYFDRSTNLFVGGRMDDQNNPMGGDDMNTGMPAAQPADDNSGDMGGMPAVDDNGEEEKEEGAGDMGGDQQQG